MPVGRQQGDIQPGGQCHHEFQQCLGQLAKVLILRKRGLRMTGPERSNC